MLYLQADIDDPAIPFTLGLLLAGRFAVDGDVGGAALEREAVSLCYPFLCEAVANVTGRSPLPPYYLPRRSRARVARRL